MSSVVTVTQETFFQSLTGVVRGNSRWKIVTLERAGLNLVAAHLIALAGVALFMILLCLGILQDRYRRRRRQLAKIPRDEMPILRSRDLSKAHLKLIVNEIVNSKNTRIEPPVDLQSSLEHNISIADSVNFKQNILNSLSILEKAAVHVGATKRENDASVSDYLKHLRAKCPELSPALCDSYLKSLQEARTGIDACTPEQYAAFVNGFIEMIQAFERQERINRGLSPLATMSSSARKDAASMLAPQVSKKKLKRSKPTTVDGRPAVELQEIDGSKRAKR